MYSVKKNINILTSLLIGHGVRHVVVCPGSRNAPLVHNFSQCPQMTCYPATDERSAGFLALGLRQQLHAPVAVCVTSGSALLNVLPAVAEATYQQQGIIVISADRPAAWIDQLDGQTLPQPQSLGAFAPVCVSLPEVEEDATAAWHCNRLVNEALLANGGAAHPSVHINVPVSEPLFDFSVESLPEERIVRGGCWSDVSTRSAVLDTMAKAQRPMIVIGQMSDDTHLSSACIKQLCDAFVVLSEPISAHGLPPSFTDQMLSVIGTDVLAYQPDCVLYVGGHTVSKRLRHFLRALSDETVQMLVSADGRLRDVSQHTSLLVQGEAVEVLEAVASVSSAASCTFLERWSSLRAQVAKQQENEELPFGEKLAVKLFEQRIDQLSEAPIVYYANSLSVRLAALYAHHYCGCNRGVNGIEGSLSVAAGASLARPDKPVYCVIGDLSFFYDQNALWQQQLQGNFRILLLNNGQGGIFRSLKGLEKSPVADTFVAGSHHTSASGVCEQFHVMYRSACDLASLSSGIDWLCCAPSDRPMLLELTINN